MPGDVASTTYCKCHQKSNALFTSWSTESPERCGNIYLADAKFCRGCGHRRGGVADTKVQSRRAWPTFLIIGYHSYHSFLVPLCILVHPCASRPKRTAR